MKYNSTDFYSNTDETKQKKTVDRTSKVKSKAKSNY